MAAAVVRDEPRRKPEAVRHPCSVGKARAKAAGPGKVNGAATKKARVKAAKSYRKGRKASVKGRAAALKAAAKTSGRAAVAAKRPC